jgi:NAD(P)H-nitrite reductase large subunit
MIDRSKVIVCRCEDVTLEEVEECIDAGLTSIEEINRYLKCTKGTCQGRGCFAIVDALLSAGTASKREPQSIRPPILPVDVASLIEDEHER